MPVWDDLSRDVDRPPPHGTQGPLSSATIAVQRRAQDNVRTAAEADAAEIIARARRDIRRIVGDARRELLELSAQVQAANVELPDAALPDPSLIAAEEASHHADAWKSLSSEFAVAPDDQILPDVVPDDEELPVALNSVSPPLATPSSARTFVALFTLAGLLVVSGTVWWLRRAPVSTPVSASAPVSGPAASATTTAPADATPTAIAPETPTTAVPSAVSGRPEKISVRFEAQRATWVRTTIDGESDAGRTYAAGEKRQVEGTSEIAIRAGDAGGVLVSVDGAPATPFGPSGASLTRRFTRGTTPVPTPSVPLPAVGAAPASTPAATAVAAPAPKAAVPPPAPVTTSAPPPPVQAPSVPAAARPSTPGRVDLAASGRQWLDAYHRQDRASIDALGSPTLVINDERRPNQRFPFGLEVTRAFENEELQLSGDNATFTARMTERATTGAFVSRISQTWVRRMGEWHLQEARLVPESATPAPGR